MQQSCPCGAEFDVAEWQIRAGRGKFCSKQCMYRYRERRSGLKYNIKVQNRAWVKKGQRLSPETEFRSGRMPHNFKEEGFGRDALHDWVKHRRGPASEHRCVWCGRSDGEGGYRLEWANLSQQYRRDLSDFAVMCLPCHVKYDRLHPMSRRFQGWDKRQRAST